MIKLVTNFEEVKKDWAKTKPADFLNIDFLNIYYQHHPHIKHLFFLDNNLRLYAHIFNLTFNKTKNYLYTNFIRDLILNFINFNVLYLTNSYITNVPAFTSNKLIDLEELLKKIKNNYSLIVIPDFLFKNMIVKKNDYIKIEVEEEMVLNIKDKWNTLEDYFSDLRKKYRKKTINIMKRTHDLSIKTLTSYELELYSKEIKNLFHQVAISSSFKGPKFNTNSFVSFVKKELMSIEGYFLKKRLVGFSSSIQKNNILYSYFVGFDKELNQSYPIYGRILLQNIKTAIRLDKKQLILGRTANEYKSNFGALPIKSFIFLKIKNNLLRTILKPIYSKIRLKKWIKRRAFKEEIKKK
ncbi:MAG: hypothetical protein CMD14_09910 [Flavobacteriales bacterium]|nr:hypothetical protein [Flavobacteriales bacterium]